MLTRRRDPVARELVSGGEARGRERSALVKNPGDKAVCLVVYQPVPDAPCPNTLGKKSTLAGVLDPSDRGVGVAVALGVPVSAAVGSRLGVAVGVPVWLGVGVGVNGLAASTARAALIRP